jgi:Holliday junction resolvase RusA-like endonuclease
MSDILLEFDVVGDPIAQGSTRAFALRKGKKGPIVGIGTTNDPSGTIAKWRADVRAAFDAAWPVGTEVGRDWFPIPKGTPVAMVLEFRIDRPQSHYLPANRSRPERALRLDAPTWHTSPPDVDKLERAVLDALTHKAYDDDAQVARVRKHKLWSDRPGVTVRISVLGEQ